MSDTRTCRYCGRDMAMPCMNTRDMDPSDGDNTDRHCNKALNDLGGGERGYVQPAEEAPETVH